MKKSNIFKVAALTAVFAVAGMFANAQTETGNITKQTDAIPGQVNGSIKVIDNKGTVKYIQTKNGITSFTNSSTDVTTTTFQLGGTLTDDTYIDATGQEFGISGLTYNTAANDYDFVVVDQTTGEFRKMLISDLINSGHKIYTISLTPVDYSVLTDTYTFTNLPLALPEFKNVYVYRNGAKLLAGVDYTIGIDPFTTFIIVANSGTDGFPIYNGDKIEIHFIK